MRRVDDISDAFGYWLAGFTDGEGCFQIRQNLEKGCWFARFEIGLRVDDLPVLEDIRDHLGMGRIDLRRPRTRSAASAHLLVNRKADCLGLVEVFERFPLRAKKAEDFAVWAEAVRAWAEVIPGTPHDWSHMAHLAGELKAVRRRSQLSAGVFG